MANFKYLRAIVGLIFCRPSTLHLSKTLSNANSIKSSSIVNDNVEISRSPTLHSVSVTGEQTSAVLPVQISIAPAAPVLRGERNKGKDIKRFAIAYIMEESKDLRDALLIVSKFTNIQYKALTNVVEFTGKCGSFVLQFVEVYGATVPASHTAISEFLKFVTNCLLRNLDEVLTNSRCLDDLDDQEKCNVDSMISALIEKLDEIKRFYPLINDEDIERRPSALQADFDSVLDAAVTILDMVRDGCALVPPAFFKPAVNLAYGLLKAVKKTRTNYEDMRDLSTIVSEFVLSVAIFCSEHHIQLTKGLEQALSNFTSVLREIVEKCMSLANTSLMSRFLQQGRDSDTLTKLRAELQQAIKEFQVKTQILQHSDFHSFSRVINDKLDGDVIKGLPENPFFEGSRDDFIPEIQDDILRQIAAWIEGSSSPIFWLCGGAGFGKSSISHQLVYHLIDTGRLAAQMFFTRGSVMQRNLVTVIQTLAHELASMHPKTVPDIASATRLGGSSHEVLSAYLKRYILAPIQALKLPRSMVIVLDALDECDNYQLLLKALAEIADFSGIKIFITSRPEVSIENAIDTSLVEKVVLKRVSQAKMEDYFSVRFAKMSWPGRQPTPGDISEMAKLADGLLIWAATSCNFIENDMQDDESYQLLQNILSAGKARDIASDDQLASLYHTTLMHLFWPKHAHIFYLVFQAMLVVQVPMTVEVFAKTFDLGIRQTRAVHSALFSLQIYETLDKDVILPATQRFHSSFLDYITNDNFALHQSILYRPKSRSRHYCAEMLVSYPRYRFLLSEWTSAVVRQFRARCQICDRLLAISLDSECPYPRPSPHQANEALNRLAHDGMPTGLRSI
ncbi:hypothetical protein BJ912DRAFT_935577 [Pholiota molesta]|nr:hypothetical protein BJ912DRAFT_935577 [Pholiota molesta]